MNEQKKEIQEKMDKYNSMTEVYFELSDSDKRYPPEFYAISSKGFENYSITGSTNNCEIKIVFTKGIETQSHQFTSKNNNPILPNPIPFDICDIHFEIIAEKQDFYANVIFKLC